VLKELPPKQLIDVSLTLSGRQADAYQRAEREGIVELQQRAGSIRIEHVLELILRLKQLCNFEPTTGASAKLEDIRDRLAALVEQGHRALVFSQFTDEVFGVAAIARELQEFRPLTYVGAMSSRDRDAVIQRFKLNDANKVLVLSLRAGGLGLNLQEASYVFHVDRWWNPAAEHQAEDRSHRMGQTVPVTVFRYTCQGTIEERIQGILAAKQKLFDEFVDDVSMDLGSRMSSVELFGLFGLAPPSPRTPIDRPRNTGRALEERCSTILRSYGWHVEHTPASRDGGVDLIATRIDEVGLEHTIYVQCKDHARPVSVEVLRELLGVLPTDRPVRAMIASPSGLTSDAARLARERRVGVWDERVLVELESGRDPSDATS
jgi:hypothetical protein